MIDNLTSGVVLLDEDHRVIDCNRAATVALECLAGAETHGRLTHLGSRPVAELLLPAGGPRFHILSHAESRRRFEVFARAFRNQGRRIAVIVIRDHSTVGESIDETRTLARLSAMRQLATAISYHAWDESGTVDRLLDRLVRVAC